MSGLTLRGASPLINIVVFVENEFAALKNCAEFQKARELSGKQKTVELIADDPASGAIRLTTAFWENMQGLVDA